MMRTWAGIVFDMRHLGPDDLIDLRSGAGIDRRLVHY
jgi:hypothetical protein